MYVCFLLNNMSSNTLLGAVPIQALTGSTHDISPLLQFHWCEPVYYLVDDSPFPSDSRGKCEYFVGIATHVGHAMMFKVLMDGAHKIMHCLNIWLAVDSKTHNLWLDPINNAKLVICSRHDSPHHGEQHLTSDSDQSLPMPTIDPHDLVGRMFLLPQQEDGQCFRACIIKALDDYKSELGIQPEHIHFLCSVTKDGKFE
jgi:hypothetical protein